jgi:2-oxoglutarate ferredoxin oxidoreductase subunit beta
VTWNKVNTFAWFRERVYRLEDENWDVTDRAAALALSLTVFHDMTCSPESCRVPLGVFVKEEGRLTYEEQTPASAQPGYTHAEKPRDVSALMRTL